MKIAIIGGAGAMARTTILDLLDNPEVDRVLIADYQAEKDEKIANSLNDNRVEAGFPVKSLRKRCNHMFIY